MTQIVFGMVRGMVCVATRVFVRNSHLQPREIVSKKALSCCARISCMQWPGQWRKRRDVQFVPTQDTSLRIDQRRVAGAQRGSSAQRGLISRGTKLPRRDFAGTQAQANKEGEGEVQFAPTQCISRTNQRIAQPGGLWAPGWRMCSRQCSRTGCGMETGHLWLLQTRLSPILEESPEREENTVQPDSARQHPGKPAKHTLLV